MIARCGICESKLAVLVPTRLLHHTDGSHEAVELEHVNDNVTRIHPAPSIPNPLTTNPWAGMTDAELDSELLRTEVRLDAVRHTLDSLTRERARRDDARPDDSGRRVRMHTHPLGEPCPLSCAHSTADRCSNPDCPLDYAHDGPCAPKDWKPGDPS